MSADDRPIEEPNILQRSDDTATTEVVRVALLFGFHQVDIHRKVFFLGLVSQLCQGLQRDGVWRVWTKTGVDSAVASFPSTAEVESAAYLSLEGTQDRRPDRHVQDGWRDQRSQANVNRRPR
jgi:hypothetical protein